jgi:hypothetical protein
MVTAVKLLTVTLIAMLNVSSICSAQEVRAAATVDAHNVLIGDWVKLHIEVQHPDNINVQFPSIPDSLEGFEIIKRDSLSTKKSDHIVMESTTYTLTAFDSGTYIIPPFIFHYAPADNAVKDTAATSPIAVFVHSVGVDTTKEIKDIKPPISLSISFAELLPYILGVVGVCAAAWLIYYILKKRKRGEPILPAAPPRPSHEVALEALRSLGAEKLWQRGMVKEYHSQLTDIVRTYIERRFGVMAMEMITDEILSAAPIDGLENELKRKLRQILVLADLVKFAKFQPLPEENERSLHAAAAFVESTWRTTHEPLQQEAAQEVRA